MAKKTDLEEAVKLSLAESRKKAKEKKDAKKDDEKDKSDKEPDKDEDDKDESKDKDSKEKEDMKEETEAASSLHPAARSVADPKALSSKSAMLNQVLGTMASTDHSKMVEIFNMVMAQFGPGISAKGVDDKSDANKATLNMKPSLAVGSGGPSTKDPMPQLAKEDVDAMFAGEELTEEFKEKCSTLFEAAVSARLIAETARLEEQYETKLTEAVAELTENINTKMDAYLDHIVEQWMEENEVAIESTLRNELMSEFVDGLKNLFSEHYINVPEDKVDVLESLAEKVSTLETKVDELMTENLELKNEKLVEEAKNIFEELSADLALTQKETFSSLVEGIEFNGDLETFEKKLKIIKENYFRTESAPPTNLTEEVFEGDTAQPTHTYVDPNVSRIAASLGRTVKK